MSEPQLTLEEYENSSCKGKYKNTSTSSYRDSDGVLKTTTIDSYRLCSKDCDGRVPKCHYAIRGRCPYDPDGPTCQEISDMFLEHIQTTKPSGYAKFGDPLSLYLTCCIDHVWYCPGCTYWVKTVEDDKQGSAFNSTHGVKTLLSGVMSFCSYFLIRKCCSSDTYRLSASKCFKTLVLFCVDRFGYDKSEAKLILDDLKVSGNFQGQRIGRELDKLKKEGYWINLEKEEILKRTQIGNGTDVGSKRTVIEAELDGVEEKKNSNEDEFEDVYDNDFGWKVNEKITKEGWVFKLPCYDGDFINGKYIPNTEQKYALLKLPEKVCKLGRKGMRISCMCLGLRNGIWSPFSSYDGESACANVYPPGYMMM